MAQIQCSYAELKPIHHLQPHPENPHIHSPEQIDRLAEIIDYQGIRHPIVVSKRSGFIVAGHGRLAALKKLNVSDVPIDYQDFADEAQEYEFIVSDNAIGKDEWAALDIELIQKKIDILPIKIPMLGLKDFEIKKLEPQSDEDEVPETPVEPVSKLGDIYEIGNHRLMCGDSTSIDAVENLMNGEKADFIFTDPPYGVGFNYNNSNDEGGEKYAETMREIWHIISSMNCPIVLTPGNNNVGLWFSFADFKMACWIKKNAMSPASVAHLNVFEILLCYGVKNRRSTDLFEYAVNYKQQDTGDHPCPKLLKLVEDAIGSWAPEKALLFEPFGGSGSTLIACEKTNRKCFMMELDPHYCDVIVTRWVKYTGQTKIKRNGEEVTWNG